MAEKTEISGFDFIKLLKTFSRKEVLEFSKFIDSPFYNNHSTLIKLFKELKKYYPGFCDQRLTKKYLFNIVNKGVKYNDNLFRKYFSLLYKLSEEYLNILEIRKSDKSFDLNVLRQISARNTDSIFNKKLKEIKKKNDKEKKTDSEDFYYLYDLNNLNLKNNIRKSKLTDINSVLIESVENLFTYFISYAGYGYSQLVTNSKTMSNPEDIRRVEFIFKNFDLKTYIEMLENRKSVNSSKAVLILKLIYYDLKLNSDTDSETAYRNLKEFLISNSEFLDKKLIHLYNKRLIVFCMIRQLNNINSYDRELFDNFKFMLDNRLFFIDDGSKLLLNDFRAILYSAMSNNDYDWAENFIAEFKDKVSNMSESEMYHFGMSSLNFNKKRFEDSLEHLSKIKTKHVYFLIDTYILKSKIFYELNYTDSAISVTNAFRHFLNRNTLISENIKKGLLIYLVIFKKLIKLRQRPDAFKLEILCDKISGSVNIRNKVWLREKCDDIRKNSEKK